MNVADNQVPNLIPSKPVTRTSESSNKQFINLDQKVRQQCQILFQNISPAIDPSIFHQNNIVALRNIHQLILPRDQKPQHQVTPKEQAQIAEENQRKRAQCHQLIQLNFEILVESLLQVINRSV